MNLQELKTAYRNKHKALRRALTDEEKYNRDAALTRAIAATNAFKNSKQLLLYAALPIEPATDMLFEEAVSQGKRVLYPRCFNGGIMRFHYVDDLSALVPSDKHIPEPSAELPLYEPADGDICIVPGISYDRGGFRLGFGGGYYDRFLQDFKGTRIGVCYSDNIEYKLPKGRFDVRVDILITEKGLFRIK